MIWLPADNTDVHWIYVVKSDGSGGRFLLVDPASPPSSGASGQSQHGPAEPRVTTVTGLDPGTRYWFAVLAAQAPSESGPGGWFRWSNWAHASTLVIVTVAEGDTADLTVNVTPTPMAPLTVNYAIGTDNDPANVDANDAPTFTSGATFSLAENTTTAGTVTATDPDAADSVTGYSLSGTDADLFQITTAGALTLSWPPTTRLRGAGRTTTPTPTN